MRIEDALRLAMQHFNAGRADIGAGICGDILKAQPQNPVANALLARHLKRTGDATGALRHAEAALSVAPDYPPARETLATTLAEAEPLDRGRAQTAFHRALVLSPDAWALWFDLGNLHQARLDNPAGSLPAYRRAAICHPTEPRVAMNRATAALKTGAITEADAICDATLAREPRHVRSLAFKTLTLAATGRGEAAEDLIGWQEMTRAMTLPVPDGFADHAAFNAAFEAAIRAHPNLQGEWDPNRRAIRGGAIVTDLLKSDDPAIRGFHAALDQAVAAYANALPDRPNHPHVAGRPGATAIDCWANILQEQGHQTGHIHNLGWLSGVYYVTLPPALRDDDPGQEGWIEFNRPGYGIPDIEGVKLRTVRPLEGMLVVFPSYVWHRTIPFTGGGERISVAFDLHPR